MMDIKNFYKNHPYWSVILLGLIVSLFGITIEYLINRDFYWKGIYSLLFFYVIALSAVKYQQNKKKK